MHDYRKEIVAMPKKKNATAPSVLAANSRYRSKFKYTQVRLTDEQKNVIDENTDGKSVNQYILDLIRNDLKKKGIELP